MTEGVSAHTKFYFKGKQRNRRKGNKSQ